MEWLEEPETLERNVCAVIVTFHPSPEHLGNIAIVRPQVRNVVMVDNGSSDEVPALRAAAQEEDFHLIEHVENLGVAAALNIGVRWAQSQGCDWVILFDQDSTAGDGLVEVLLNAYEADPDRGRIGTLVPTYVDKSSRNEMFVERSRDGQILTASTSGSLIPVSVFERCGYFREDFFIDQIDYEFCLRIVTAGYRIVQCADAKLMHSLGERKEYGVAGRHMLTSTHHNSIRRYYIIRNRVVLLRLYWKKFPSYCLNLFTLTCKDTIKVLLVERDKLEKLKNTARGLIDGVLGRMGKRVEL
jgi:rhamnosyltransferase